MTYLYFLIRELWRSRRRTASEIRQWWGNKKQVARLQVYMRKHPLP